MRIVEGSMPSPLPIILGRPFMRTANMKICVKKGTVSMKVNGEKIVFKDFEESQLPQDELECFNVCMIQGVVENTFQDHQIDPLEVTLTHSVTRKDKEPIVEDVTKDIMKVVQPLVPSPSHFKTIKYSTLVSSSINGLVIVLSQTCFLIELYRFIVQRKIKHSR